MGYSRRKAARKQNDAPGIDDEPVVPRGELDLWKDTDRRLLVKMRWRRTAEDREQDLAALDIALGLAIERRDPKRINNIVRTRVMIEGQNQADEHLALRLQAAGFVDEAERTELDADDQRRVNRILDGLKKRRRRAIRSSSSKPNGSKTSDNGS